MVTRLTWKDLPDITEKECQPRVMSTRLCDARELRQNWKRLYRFGKKEV